MASLLLFRPWKITADPHSIIYKTITGTNYSTIPRTAWGFKNILVGLLQDTPSEILFAIKTSCVYHLSCIQLTLLCCMVKDSHRPVKSPPFRILSALFGALLILSNLR